jgi:hypothetical protein
MTKLSTALPKGDGNGLDAIARQLVDDPHELHVVIAIVDCKQSKIDHDTDEREPTARLRRIEVIQGDDKRVAQQMMRRALEERTGQTVLPIDLEDELREAFGDIDPHTGEILSDRREERSDDADG